MIKIQEQYESPGLPFDSGCLAFTLGCAVRFAFRAVVSPAASEVQRSSAFFMATIFYRSSSPGSQVVLLDGADGILIMLRGRKSLISSMVSTVFAASQ
jgi:hypothetical protein